MSISDYRRKENRCDAVTAEIRKGTSRTDSWRCNLQVGHVGPHVSHSGHRTWTGEGRTWNFKNAVHQDELFDTSPPPLPERDDES